MRLSVLSLLLLALVLCGIVPSAAAAPVSLPAIRAHLIQFEGYRTAPYRDGNGWSVGVGHSLSAHREAPKARYTAAEIERYLMQDIAWANDAARQGIESFDDLPERAQLVAIGVAFTVGRTGFQRFVSFRRALGYRAYNAAAHELALSRWADQVGARRRDAYVNTLLSL